ncbi:MAG: transcription termination factor NusA [Anaerovoracaceae bacterium]|jgi:N utilization substance protein A
MNNEFVQAIDMLEKEKGISKEVLYDAIESALISAYKKNYGFEGEAEVRIDRETGDINVVSKLTVVDPDEIEDEGREITLEDAKAIDEEYELGDIVEFQVTPKDFGRIAAQTAKQVVVQRIREAERTMVYENFIERVGDVLTGKVQRKSGETIFVNLGSTEGILSVKEQVKTERYKVNDRIKVYIMDVKNSTKGPQVFLSRSHPGLVKRLFEMEVPEIEDGIVEIKSIAREAGSRTKIAVYTEDENVDPVGACVGARGSRVQSIVDELFNEKIDIITWSDDPVELISNVLSPAKVEQVNLNEEEKIATVIVPDYQLSLAIGKSGQNVRLAAKLCGWKIDIKSHTQYFGDEEQEELEGYDEGPALEETAEVPLEEAEEAEEAIEADEAEEAAVAEAEEPDVEIEEP